jgi:eukaryotic-like serine/threonine-protein kinase
MSSPAYSDRYEILRHLARGGMAEVYLARDHLLDRPVAVKVLSAEFARDPSFVERFRREARAAANLSHPGIVSVYDWGEAAGTYYIVMEYVEGRSLRDVVQHSAPLHPHRAAEIAGDIADALANAHDKGVVHRDVKPGNVLITPQGQVKVTDFGIARAGVADNLTQTGAVMGTAVYFSPEQAQGFPTDGRSDIYSLGVVLYEMVTSYPPFGGDSPVAIAYKHVRETPVQPTLLNPDIPPDLEAIILTALAKNPNDRYQTARDFRADLVRFRQGQRIMMAPVTAMVAEIPTGAVPSAAIVPQPVAQPPARPQQPTQVVIRPPDPNADVRRAAVVHGRGPNAATVGTRVLTPPPRNRFARAILFTLTFVALVAAIAALVAVIADKVTSDDGAAVEVSVPDVTGLSETEATIRLENDGFVVFVEEIVNTARPEGTVFAQKPDARTLQPQGTQVTITVAKVAGQVTIPVVQGMPVEQALSALRALELVPSTEPRDDASAIAGTVIESAPAAGTTVSTGTEVKLIVAQTPGQLTVPLVDTLDQVTATQRLRDAGFTQIVTQNEGSDTVTLGNVIRTEPPGNTAVGVGSPVRLFVSTGPDEVTVPNVRGLTEAAAFEAIGINKLVPSATSSSQCAEGDNGKVINQTPAFGQRVAPGAGVTITVCQFVATTTAPTTTPTTPPTEPPTTAAPTTPPS